MIVIMVVIIVKRHIMSMGIVAIEFVAGGVDAPIRMDFFPIMKARQTGSIQGQPDIAGA